jgi:hypothetical protein
VLFLQKLKKEKKFKEDKTEEDHSVDNDSDEKLESKKKKKDKKKDKKSSNKRKLEETGGECVKSDGIFQFNVNFILAILFLFTKLH